MKPVPRLLVRVSMLALCVLVTLPLIPGAPTPPRAQAQKLRFGVGPLQPTPTETKKAFEPFFAYVAKKLDRDFDLVATTDWAGISVALANEQVDVAWMGPWGHVLANNDSGVTAIATAKYDGKPIYHARRVQAGQRDQELAPGRQGQARILVMVTVIDHGSQWLRRRLE